MENNKLKTKCCICGRVKGEGGWEYEFPGQNDDATCSHGFCEACYEDEIRKMKMQTALSVMTG